MVVKAVNQSAEMSRFARLTLPAQSRPSRSITLNHRRAGGKFFLVKQCAVSATFTSTILDDS
jgi:hypothetical protein